jgi:hypothetical protein
MKTRLGTYIPRLSVSSIANHFVGSRHVPSTTCPSLPIPAEYVKRSTGKNNYTDFWSVEYDRRETRRHFTVQSDLHTGLDLVLRFDQRIKQLIRMDNGLAVIRHQTDNGGIPLVHNLGKSGGT